MSLVAYQLDESREDEFYTRRSRDDEVKAAKRSFEIGIYSFAELVPDPASDERVSPAQRLQNLLEAVRLADQVGLEIFGLGEHHRQEFVSSAPAVILAAAAAQTRAIRLSTAVTVLKLG